MTIYHKALATGCGLVAATAAVLFMAPGKQANGTPHIDTTQGMVVVIDEQSGTLRAPTVDEARRYQTPAQRSAEALPVQLRADGSESMKLDDRYIIYSTVERRADGSWSRQCSMDHDHAQHAQKAVK